MLLQAGYSPLCYIFCPLLILGFLFLAYADQAQADASFLVEPPRQKVLQDVTMSCTALIHGVIRYKSILSTADTAIVQNASKLLGKSCRCLIKPLSSLTKMLHCLVAVKGSKLALPILSEGMKAIVHLMLAGFGWEASVWSWLGRSALPVGKGPAKGEARSRMQNWRRALAVLQAQTRTWLLQLLPGCY